MDNYSKKLLMFLIVPLIINGVFQIKYSLYIGFQIILLILILITSKIFSVKLSSIGIKKIKLKELLGYTTKALVLIILVNIILILFSNEFKFVGFTNWFLINILVFLFVSIVEEIYFRGLILKSLEFIKSKNTRILICSLIFMLSHSERSPISYLITLSLGVILAYMYIKNNNLYLSILIHTFWNLNMTNSIFEYKGITEIEIFEVLLILIALYSFGWICYKITYKNES